MVRTVIEADTREGDNKKTTYIWDKLYKWDTHISAKRESIAKTVKAANFCSTQSTGITEGISSDTSQPYSNKKNLAEDK